MGVHKIGLLCTFIKAKSTNQNQSKYISLLLKVKKKINAQFQWWFIENNLFSQARSISSNKMMN